MKSFITTEGEILGVPECLTECVGNIFRVCIIPDVTNEKTDWIFEINLN